MKTMMGKIHLAVLGCLLGALSVGHAERWIDEEDQKVVEFVKASQTNPMLGWQNCADAVNQVRSELELEPIRTSEACRRRWMRDLKERNPELQFHGKCPRMRRPWTTDESQLLVACVGRCGNGNSIDWNAVSQSMASRGQNRSAPECREHWKTIAPYPWRIITPWVDFPRMAAAEIVPELAAAAQAPDAQGTFGELPVPSEELSGTFEEQGTFEEPPPLLDGFGGVGNDWENWEEITRLSGLSGFPSG
jgi:hypothetical protein